MNFKTKPMTDFSQRDHLGGFAFPSSQTPCLTPAAQVGTLFCMPQRHRHGASQEEWDNQDNNL